MSSSRPTRVGLRSWSVFRQTGGQISSSSILQPARLLFGPGAAPVPVVGLAPADEVDGLPESRCWLRCDRIIAGPIVDGVRSNGSRANWDDLHAVIDREWPALRPSIGPQSRR